MTLTPDPGWKLPEAPECPACGVTAVPCAIGDKGWSLGWVCEECREHSYEPKIPWMFGECPASSEDLGALGFEVEYL